MKILMNEMEIWKALTRNNFEGNLCSLGIYVGDRYNHRSIENLSKFYAHLRGVVGLILDLNLDHVHVSLDSVVACQCVALLSPFVSAVIVLDYPWLPP